MLKLPGTVKQASVKEKSPSSRSKKKQFGDQSLLQKLFTCLALLTLVSLLVHLSTDSTTYTINSVITFSVQQSVINDGGQQSQQLVVSNEKCAFTTMTIVSGYLNIGSFRKGYALNFTVEDYRSWVQPFAFLQNPVIFYTDDEFMAITIEQMRVTPNLAACTRIRMVNRTHLWGFQLLENISAVLNQPDYPKFYPNTVVPQYSAVMHSKFSMLQWAIAENPFQTDEFAWMDSGLFRQETAEKNPISLTPPPGFDRTRVAVNQIMSVDFRKNFPEIFRSESLLLAGGGFFVATGPVMQQFCEQYREFTTYYLQQGYSNTDQQVIYAMYTESMLNTAMRPRIQITRYVHVRRTAESWYHLRWLSQDEGVRQIRRQVELRYFRPQSSAQSYFKQYLRTVRNLEEPSESCTMPIPKVCDSDVTVVVGFFSIGSFVKKVDDEMVVLDSSTYTEHFSELAKARNPVIAFFDCPTMLNRFLTKREQLGFTNCTYVYLVQRKSLWSWAMMPWIQRLLPKHPQLTAQGLIPEYVSSLHSKFALVRKAVQINPFNTSRFAWLDASVADHLKKLPFFALRKVLQTQQSVEFPFFTFGNDSNSQNDSDVRQVCQTSLSAKVFVGEAAAMDQFSVAYRAAAEISLTWGLVLKDDELLNAMTCWRNLSTVLRQRVKVQLPQLVAPLRGRAIRLEQYPD